MTGPAVPAEPTPQMDPDRLDALLGRVIGDLGATTTAGGVVVGHRLGLYTALAQGPATPDELAGRTGTDPRYVAEWLRRAGRRRLRRVRPGDRRVHLTPEQAFALADPAGPLYLPGAFVLALGALRAEPRITEAFRTGAGMGWHEHDDDVFLGCELFFRPGYTANLVAPGCPRSTASRTSCSAGGRVADVGCGLGASAVLLAQAFPRATVVGSDYHEDSVRARPQAGRRGRASRTG